MDSVNLQLEMQLGTLQESAKQLLEQYSTNSTTDKAISAAQSITDLGLQALLLKHALSGAGNKSTSMPTQEEEIEEPEVTTEPIQMDNISIDTLGGDLMENTRTFLSSEFLQRGSSLLQGAQDTGQTIVQSTTRAGEQLGEEVGEQVATRIGGASSEALEGASTALDTVAETTSEFGPVGAAVGIASLLGSAALQLYEIFKPTPKPPVENIAQYTMEEA